MKRWSGGILILSLTVLLLRRYSLFSNSAVPRRLQLSADYPLYNPTPNLTWPHLLPILSRADSLPNSAAAACEAAAAWSTLAPNIEPKPHPSSNATSTSCPFSSAASGLGGNTALRSIPCGLVEGCAINVVAVPSGPFYIELIGSGTPLAIVLRYNVSLSDDDSSSIAQSSWTSAHGWADWQW